MDVQRRQEVADEAPATHGFDRATRDLDLFVATDAANVERLREGLTDVFDDSDSGMITAADLGGRYPAVRYGPATPRWTNQRPAGSEGSIRPPHLLPTGASMAALRG